MISPFAFHDRPSVRLATASGLAGGAPPLDERCH
jgi:hypothetical protein